MAAMNEPGAAVSVPTRDVMTRDPVCGMIVDPEDSAARANH